MSTAPNKKRFLKSPMRNIYRKDGGESHVGGSTVPAEIETRSQQAKFESQRENDQVLLKLGVENVVSDLQKCVKRIEDGVSLNDTSILRDAQSCINLLCEQVRKENTTNVEDYLRNEMAMLRRQLSQSEDFASRAVVVGVVVCSGIATALFVPVMTYAVKTCTSLVFL
mmetsp:Transcript_4643/g.6257  ORF Transcript_4643/g.6257 Transcript_4643/m.6257 type:complete len:168 (-) Transcript_4643:222-725(-)